MTRRVHTSISRLLWVGVFLLLSFSCGKKGPLELPEDVRPVEVTDLRAESVEGATVITWSRPRKNADGSTFRDLAGFLIIRSEGEDHTFRKVHFMELRGTDIRNGKVTWTDPQTTSGQTYHYRVAAKNSLKVFSLPSNVATVRAAPRVPAPANIRGEGGDGFALLSWDPVTGSSGYLVYRAMSEEGPFERITKGIQREAGFRDQIPNTQTFYYQVRAVGEADALGTPSAVVGVRPRRSTPPGPVGGLKAGYTTGAVYLTWEAMADAASFGAYEVCRVSGMESICHRTAQPSFVDRSVPESGEVRYEVRVIDNSAEPVAGDVSGITVTLP